MILEKLKITDTFKQWRDKINLIIDSYSGVPATDLETGIITIDTEHVQAYEFIVKIPTTFTNEVTFENVTINGTIDASVESANRLTVPVEINGISFDGTQNITTPQWGVSRNISISDYYNENSGETISVNGSKNYTLSLPKKIKADIEGSSTTSEQLKNTVFVDGINFNGSSDILHYCVCNSTAGSQVKKVTLDNFKLKFGATVTVQFINGNTITNPQLNVNNTGNIPIYSNNSPAPYSAISEHSIITFIYDGSVFNIVSGEDNKVLQQKTNSNKEYPLLFSSVTDISLSGITSNSLYSGGLVINPSNNNLTLDGSYYTKNEFVVKNLNDSWNLVPSSTTIKKYLEYKDNTERTLSRFELVWLYYNSLYGTGKSKFKPLIEKYALFKNLRDEFLTISKDVIEKDYFRKYQMIIDDYQNYLTTDKNDKSKYYIGAFYNSRDKESFLKAIEDFKNSPAAKLDK